MHEKWKGLNPMDEDLRLENSDEHGKRRTRYRGGIRHDGPESAKELDWEGRNWRTLPISAAKYQLHVIVICKRLLFLSTTGKFDCETRSARI